MLWNVLKKNLGEGGRKFFFEFEEGRNLEALHS